MMFLNFRNTRLVDMTHSLVLCTVSTTLLLTVHNTKQWVKSTNHALKVMGSQHGCIIIIVQGLRIRFYQYSFCLMTLTLHYTKHSYTETYSIG